MSQMSQRMAKYTDRGTERERWTNRGIHKEMDEPTGASMSSRMVGGGGGRPVERSMTAVRLGKRSRRLLAASELGALRSAMSHSCKPSSSRSGCT